MNRSELYFADLADVLDGTVGPSQVATVTSFFNTVGAESSSVVSKFSMRSMEYGRFSGNKIIEAFWYNPFQKEIEKTLVMIRSITHNRPVQVIAQVNSAPSYMHGIEEITLEAITTPMPLTEAEKFVCNVHNIKYPDWREMRPDEDPTRR